MITDAAHGRRNREGYGDVVVEHGFVVALAQVTMIVAMELLQAVQAFHHVGAHRTEQQPVHLEQADQCSMQEQIDGLAVGDALVGREADRIDAEEGGLVGQTQQRLQARDHAGTPRLGGLERRETLLELFFVDHSPLLPLRLWLQTV